MGVQKGALRGSQPLDPGVGFVVLCGEGYEQEMGGVVGVLPRFALGCLLSRWSTTVIPAPIPADETERLADLRSLRILDTRPEERFDRITRLLSRVFRVPMAFVSLVDSDRQWFKSSCGLNVLQTPRAVSFCGHAILSDEMMVVNDALEDERFRDNPIVLGEPGIRFYAGEPLVGPGGHRIGSLCIADRVPRQLDEDQRQALREVARLVERELELVEVVSVQRELITAKAQLAEAEGKRAEALELLVATQKRQMRELDQAAAYVRSLLPVPLERPPVRTQWRFQPCSTLGGDSFGYEWIDHDHFASYLLDVSGHGVGAALLSVSVVNTLRARTLSGVNFREPAEVLTALNHAFPMERHDGKYFTMWYGVYQPLSRRLRYSCAGHPPARLLPAEVDRDGLDLGRPALGIGMFPDATYHTQEAETEPGSRLEVFSDGAYEIMLPGGQIGTRDDLIAWLAEPAASPASILERVRRTASTPLQDDFCLLEVGFD